MKIYAIVVTYNGMMWYDRCFKSLISSEILLDVIVIDNASSDESVSYIKDNFPTIHIIESQVNLGFTMANNIGIKYALDNNADYVFLLNQDAWLVESNALSYLVDVFKNNVDAGIVSPIHFNGLKSGLDSNFAYNMPWTFVSDAYFQTMKEFYEVQFVNAAAWLISNKCIQKVGGFDSSLFVHNGEDGNYCQRALYHGFKIVVNSGSHICHDKETLVETLHKDYDSIWKTKEKNLMRKIVDANIMEEREMGRSLNKQWRNLIINVVLLRFSKVKFIYEEIFLLKLIWKSREINKIGGLNWL
jgi:GT2 family glycosyltransferase